MWLTNLFSDKWFDLYKGRDFERYQNIRQSLDSRGIRYRGKEYTAVSRIAMHALTVPVITPSRGPTVTPYELQSRLLSSKKLDTYYIEVKKKDMQQARKCLASA
jgi:hypothetical protein